MTDSIAKIAEDLERLKVEMAGLNARIENEPLDRDHIRSKLDDYSMVMTGLHQRLIALSTPPGQKLPDTARAV